MKDARVQAALLAVLAILLVAGGYVFQPFWTADRLASAFRAGDLRAAGKLIDYARVQESIRAQLGNGLRGESANALTSMINASTQPERIAAFLRNGRLLDPEEAENATARVQLPRPRTRSLQGLTGFEVQYHRLALTFRFEGLQWRLVGVKFADAVAQDLRTELASAGRPLPVHSAE
ncbi:MAG TPA: DUF2939 domain-containing protein [Gammaproteobacteria bacterium]|nr:DUF2939 domain-containing protein [Gammaproteobacteria bacterium]